MLKELIKLASDLDRMGHVTLANEVDRILMKISAPYGQSTMLNLREEGEKSPLYGSSMWGSRLAWNSVLPSSIQEHYYTIANNDFGLPGTEKVLNEYLDAYRVQDFQRPKVIQSIKEDPRWGKASSDYSSSSSSSEMKMKKPVGDLTTEQKLKLLISDKDDSVPYKMSPDTFAKIKDGDDLGLQDLEEADLKILDF